MPNNISNENGSIAIKLGKIDYKAVKLPKSTDFEKRTIVFENDKIITGKFNLKIYSMFTGENPLSDKYIERCIKLLDNQFIQKREFTFDRGFGFVIISQDTDRTYMNIYKYDLKYVIILKSILYTSKTDSGKFIRPNSNREKNSDCIYEKEIAAAEGKLLSKILNQKEKPSGLEGKTELFISELQELGYSKEADSILNVRKTVEIEIDKQRRINSYLTTAIPQAKRRTSYNNLKTQQT